MPPGCQQSVGIPIGQAAGNTVPTRTSVALFYSREQSQKTVIYCISLSRQRAPRETRPLIIYIKHKMPKGCAKRMSFLSCVPCVCKT